MGRPLSDILEPELVNEEDAASPRDPRGSGPRPPRRDPEPEEPNFDAGTAEDGREDTLGAATSNFELGTGSQIAGGPTGRSRGLLRVPQSAGTAVLGNYSDRENLILRDFSRGMVTNHKRGVQPPGSFVDSLNLVPNTEIGGLVQRYGTSFYNSLSFGTGVG